MNVNNINLLAQSAGEGGSGKFFLVFLIGILFFLIGIVVGYALWRRVKGNLFELEQENRETEQKLRQFKTDVEAQEDLITPAAQPAS